MNTSYEPSGAVDGKVVYVRSVNVSDLPKEAQEHMGDLTLIYAVHAPDGERLALVRERGLAFALARQNDFLPVTVH